MTNTDRILTTHVGSLPRPAELIELNRHRMDDDDFDEAGYDELLAAETAKVVARQAEVGLDLRNDGEFGHVMAIPEDYGSWLHYVFPRIGGWGADWRIAEELPYAPSKFQLEFVTYDTPHVEGRYPNRDALFFPEFYDEGVWQEVKMKTSPDDVGGGEAVPYAAGPLTYIGQDEVQRDIDNLRAGLAATGSGTDAGFLCAIGPGTLGDSLGNGYYETTEDFIWACAEVLAVEYKAITDAGLSVQIDDPNFAASWSLFNPEPDLKDFEEFTMARVEALNHALRGIPREQVRFHCCWGSWHAPHVADVEMKNIAKMLMKIDAGTFLFEAANARHEHEWVVWEDVKIPDGVKLAPGVVSHSTMLVEHPELVAQRIERFAGVVGPENVIAGTDCGMGGRLHHTIAWAKLEALSQGTAIASKRLWK